MYPPLSHPQGWPTEAGSAPVLQRCATHGNGAAGSHGGQGQHGPTAAGSARGTVTSMVQVTRGGPRRCGLVTHGAVAWHGSQHD